MFITQGCRVEYVRQDDYGCSLEPGAYGTVLWVKPIRGGTSVAVEWDDGNYWCYWLENCYGRSIRPAKYHG